MASTVEQEEVISKEEAKSEWIISPKAMSLLGKVLGILLALGSSIIHIFLNFDMDMDAINRMVWTLALLGAPIDASIIFGNIGNIFKK